MNEKDGIWSFTGVSNGHFHWINSQFVEYELYNELNENQYFWVLNVESKLNMEEMEWTPFIGVRFTQSFNAFIFMEASYVRAIVICQWYV